MTKEELTAINKISRNLSSGSQQLDALKSFVARIKDHGVSSVNYHNLSRKLLNQLEPAIITIIQNEIDRMQSEYDAINPFVALSTEIENVRKEQSVHQ